MDRFLIGSFEKSQTKSGRDVVDLFDVDTRLGYPVLRLFDLSALATVGLDPNAIPDGRTFHRFYAYYRESEKLNAKGNPYRDVLHLEPLAAPATAAATDPGALLAELRAIRGLLLVIADRLNVKAPAHVPGWREANAEQPEPDLDPVAADIVSALTTDPQAEAEPKPATNGRTYGDGSQITPDNDAERAAWDLFLATYERRPNDVEELRAFVRSNPTPEL